jgi:hypothetical protein
VFFVDWRMWVITGRHCVTIADWTSVRSVNSDFTAAAVRRKLFRYALSFALRRRCA